MKTDKAFAAIDKSIDDMQPEIKQEEVSVVQSVQSGTAIVSGLANAQMDELLLFEHNVQGMVQTLNRDSVGVVFLDNPDKVKAGDKVMRTNRVLDVPVS